MNAFRTLVFAILCAAGPAAASGFGEPTQAVVLTVSGAIPATGNADPVLFDIPMLEAIGGDIIVTSTIWTDGVSEFEGVALSRLVEVLGLTDETLNAIAINDYSVEIPLLDAQDYGPIIAYKRDGAYMTIRDKGPLWIIYPFDQNKSTQTELIYSRSIWQLDRLVIE